MGYQLFELTEKSRLLLLDIFHPKFINIKCDHVTHVFGCSVSSPLPNPSNIQIIGYSSNDNIECLVVEVNGSYIRPDGKIYHITLSHDNHTKPYKSNDLIKNHGWDKFDHKLNIESIPKYRD